MIHKHVDKQVKQILIDQFKQIWQAQMTQSNKGLIYSNFKEIREFEKYFTIRPKRVFNSIQIP